MNDLSVDTLFRRDDPELYAPYIPNEYEAIEKYGSTKWTLGGYLLESPFQRASHVKNFRVSAWKHVDELEYQADMHELAERGLVRQEVNLNDEPSFVVNRLLPTHIVDTDRGVAVIFLDDSPALWVRLATYQEIGEFKPPYEAEWPYRLIESAEEANARLRDRYDMQVLINAVLPLLRPGEFLVESPSTGPQIMREEKGRMVSEAARLRLRVAA